LLRAAGFSVAGSPLNCDENSKPQRKTIMTTYFLTFLLFIEAVALIIGMALVAIS
tara:strand:- start:143 stop:307 length:165 start_codon:yes stop_codon:yes gene_type:complete